MAILVFLTSSGMLATLTPVVPIWVAPQTYTLPALDRPTVKLPLASIILMSSRSSRGTDIMLMVGGTLFWVTSV